LEAHTEAVGTAMGEFCGPQVARLQREVELLRRELTTLREEVGLERSLRDLRTEVEAARAEVPKLPEIAARLEKEQLRLRCDLERTQKRVSRARVDQSMANFKLDELGKQIESRSTAMEMKFETTVASFKMNEIHPDAGRALRSFADEALKGDRGEKIWLFDPNPRPRAGAA
jgi:chromosome segregation ATPase